MINSYAKRGPNYCVRVTADDGSEGEEQLRKFQDNEKTIPTILTTSQKLSTGVDAQNVRNIVLMRPVPNMIEFKQIIGCGTRLFDDKYYFTIYDFVGAHKQFYDEEWDNPNPVCLFVKNTIASVALILNVRSVVNGLANVNALLVLALCVASGLASARQSHVLFVEIFHVHALKILLKLK